MGRHKKPTELEKPLNTGILGTTKIPVCPMVLDKVGQKEWNKLSKHLSKNGCLGEADGIALAMYCSSWSQYIMAQEQLAKNGLTQLTPNGIYIPSPYVGIARAAAKELVTLGNGFGLTPLARVRVKSEKPSEGKALIDFLKTKNKVENIEKTD